MAVVDQFKRTADRFLRPHAFPLYFALELLYVERRNGKLVEEFTRGKPCHPLAELDFSEYKSSDTFFILGSGSSINDVTEEQWEEVDAGDSLGFNFWPIHDYVPTYYVFELPHDVRDYRETIYRLLEYRAEDYADVPIVVKDLQRTSDEIEMDRIPEELHDQIYAARDVSIPWNSDDPSSLDRSLSYLDLLGYFDETNTISTVLKKRASLAQHTMMAAMLGYDDIVFLGVDLTDSKYFFDTEQYEQSDVPRPSIEHQSGEHNTYNSEIGTLTVDEVLESIDDVVLSPRGIDLYIGSKRSALYPDLPYYFE